MPPVRIGDLAARKGIASALELRSRRDDDDARAGENRESPVPDRSRSRQSRSVEDLTGGQHRGTRLEGLARDAHVRARLRCDANLDGVGRLGDARGVIRVLDLDDGVRAGRDRCARHDAPRLPPLEAILAGVPRRDVARDGQGPRALALQVLAAHREPVHRRVRERWEWDERVDVDGQASSEALVDGKRVVGEDVAEGQGLDQLAMLRSGQGGIVHATSVGPGGVGDACRWPLSARSAVTCRGPSGRGSVRGQVGPERRSRS